VRVLSRMLCFLNVVLFGLTLTSAVAFAQTSSFPNVGRTASEEEVRAWDISIGPEGKELPPGSGTPKQGADVYEQKCAACHGPNGEGGNPNNNPGNPARTARALVGGRGTIGTQRPVRTVGSFWPYATTLWDHINRAMPMFAEGSLTANEVYSLTAFLLYKNEIIGENDVMDSKTLPKVQMPNRNGFVPARPEWKPGSGSPH
jgi:S-disulfanyl-L-cysteine oxidoreductase SoxD